ncbi:MAG: hypothetical protein ACK5O2_11080 [Microthrixaceae bacterium]
MSSAEVRSNKKRTAATVVAFATMALAVAIVSLGGSAGGQEAGKIISIDYAAAPSQGDGCASREDSMSMAKQTTAESYSFVVTVATDLCSPVPATAVAYAMPDNRSWPWPQRLLESEAVTFEEAGVYTISFAKACDPIQFDLVTGATPELIDPFGAHHGPLVFPHTDQYNTNGSAYQYWPPRATCTPTTTTTPSGPTSSTTTSSVPVTVNPSTTIQGPGVTTPGGGTTPTVGGNSGTNPAASPAATVGAAQESRAASAPLSVAG